MKKTVVICCAVFLCIIVLVFLLYKDTQVSGEEKVKEPVEETIADQWITDDDSQISRTTVYEKNGDKEYRFDEENHLLFYQDDNMFDIDALREEERADKDIVLASFIEKYSDFIPNLEEYEIVWFKEEETGWDINLIRHINDVLYDRIVLSTTPNGTVRWFRVYQAGMESISEEVLSMVQDKIDQYVSENEKDCISYDSEIRYEMIEDEKVAAYCTLIFHYEDGTSYGTILTIVVP